MKILIASDFNPATFPNLSTNKKRVYGSLIKYFEQTDYHIINLECSLYKGIPIKKQGPCLYCDPKYLSLLWPEKTILTLANNHLGDYGKEGIDKTREVLNKKNIKWVGIDPYSAVLLGNSIESIHIYNICESEVGTEYCYNWSKFSDLVSTLSKPPYHKSMVIVHGGSEGGPTPSRRIIEDYQILKSCSSSVVGHHSHVPMVFEDNIYYGIGNFLFKSRFSDRGFFVIYDTETNKSEIVTFRITDNGLQEFDFKKDLVAQNKKNGLIEWKKFAKMKFQKDYKRLLIKFLQENRYVDALNFLQTESHLDILRDGLKELIKDNKK